MNMPLIASARHHGIQARAFDQVFAVFDGNGLFAFKGVEKI